MQHATKVGILMVVFAGLLLGAYQTLGKRLFQEETVTIVAEFADAGGINPGARVLMAGVRVGSVSKIELAGPALARITMDVDKDVALPRGTTAVLQGSLIGIGDPPLEIVAPPGLPQGFLKSGDVIPGRKAGAMEGLLPDLTTTISEVNRTLVAVRTLVENPKMQTELVAVLEQTKDTLKQFSNLAGTANGALAENRASIKSTIATFSVAMQDVQKSAALAAKLLEDPRFKDQAAEILASLNSTVKKADGMMASIQAMVDDPALKENLTKTMSNVADITDSGTRIASNTEKMTENGIVITDNVAELSKKVNDLADEAKDVFERIKRFFERAPTQNPLGKAETQVDILRENEPGRFRADFNARIPVSDGSVHVGLFDAFESNKINLQYGRPLGKGAEYRYGIYAGQPGLGVDLPLASRLKLRGDAFGLNDPRLDMRLQYQYRTDLLAWLGVHRIGEKNSIAAGIGIRK